MCRHNYKTISASIILACVALFFAFDEQLVQAWSKKASRERLILTPSYLGSKCCRRKMKVKLPPFIAMSFAPVSTSPAGVPNRFVLPPPPGPFSSI